MNKNYKYSIKFRTEYFSKLLVCNKFLVKDFKNYLNCKLSNNKVYYWNDDYDPSIIKLIFTSLCPPFKAMLAFPVALQTSVKTRRKANLP